jgi:hypothetical protein
MKRGRKTPPPSAPAPGIAPEAASAAKGRITEDYLGFVHDTAEEDPKHFCARSAAAREALDHLAQLRDLSAELGPGAQDDAPTTEDVLAEARADIAFENKS